MKVNVKDILGWFKPSQKPVRPGVYAVLTQSGTFPPNKDSFRSGKGQPKYWFANWTGTQWGIKHDSVKDAANDQIQSSFQNKIWGGLPKEKVKQHDLHDKVGLI